ncbi:hypothetical protein GQ600_12919 [Phytophthora cactorum]|nr:hypothetical protein GQ600_12919 [Phytophthora cactorum]
MESVKCRTCSAMVNMPPVDVDDRPLPRWKCVCCEHLLVRDPYCYRLERLDRGEVRRCLECREGPERQRHWHKVDLPPRWEPDLNRQGARKKFIRRRTQPPSSPTFRGISRGAQEEQARSSLEAPPPHWQAAPAVAKESLTKNTALPLWTKQLKPNSLLRCEHTGYGEVVLEAMLTTDKSMNERQWRIYDGTIRGC